MKKTRLAYLITSIVIFLLVIVIEAIIGIQTFSKIYSKIGEESVISQSGNPEEIKNKIEKVIDAFKPED